MRAQSSLAIGLAVGVALGVGALAGYMYRDNENYEQFILASEAGKTIGDAKKWYAVLRALEKDGGEKAKEIVRFFLHSDLFFIAEWTENLKNEEAISEADDVFEKFAAHYREYPYDFTGNPIDERLEEILVRYQQRAAQ